MGAIQCNSVIPSRWPQQLAPAEGGWRPRHCTLVIRGFSICEVGQRDRFLGWPEPEQRSKPRKLHSVQTQVTSTKSGWNSGVRILKARVGPAATVPWCHSQAVKASKWSWELVGCGGHSEGCAQEKESKGQAVHPHPAQEYPSSAENGALPNI